MSKNNKQAEVQAYIHQQLEEIKDFLTEQSEVSVLEKDVVKMLKTLKESGDVDEDFKATHCYEIIFVENELKITAYGLANNAFDAIKFAKEKLEKQLELIVEEGQSSVERNNLVNSITSKADTLH